MSRRRFFAHAEWVLVAALVLEIALFAVIAPEFATLGNFFEVSRLSVELGLLAIALTPVLITGGIDLSVGSMMGLAAVMFGVANRDWGLPIAACGARQPSRRRRGRRAERVSRRAAGHPAAHRHARHVLAVQGDRRRHHARGGELHGIPRLVPRARARVSVGRGAGAASDLRARPRRVRRAAPSIDRGARAVRDRLHAGRRALCRHPGRAPRGPHLLSVRPRLEPGGDHLRRAPRPGAIGRRERLRARRDHGGRPRRHVGVRRARHPARHGARPLLARRAPQRTPARGAAVGARGRVDRRAPPGDDRHRPPSQAQAPDS